MKRTAVFLLALLTLVLSSCATEEKRGPSEDVLLTDRALEVVEHVRAVYARGDVKAMKPLFTEEGYSRMVRDVKKFESVELEFTPRWVEIKADGAVHVQVVWEGTWDLGDNWVEVRDGMVTFVLEPGKWLIRDLKLTSPFGQPDITSPPPGRF
jgi:hypothetical protein